MTDIIVTDVGAALVAGKKLRCAVGRGGIRADKREGDGATPAGDYPLRQVFYRPDRLPGPVTGLPAFTLTPQDGWSDAPQDPLYNQKVTLPHAHRHERLWRADAVYDLIVVVGYNDGPVIRGKGSAIFIHIARPDFGPTEGCVAFTQEDLLWVLKRLDRQSRLLIRPQP